MKRNFFIAVLISAALIATNISGYAQKTASPHGIDYLAKEALAGALSGVVIGFGSAMVGILAGSNSGLGGAGSGGVIGLHLGVGLGVPYGVVLAGSMMGVEGNLPVAYTLSLGASLAHYIGFNYKDSMPDWLAENFFYITYALNITGAVIGYNLGATKKSD